MLDPQTVDELFETLARYIRVRERALHTTFRTPDGEFETAAFKGLFHLYKQSMRARELAAELGADPSTVSRHVAQLVDLGLVRREADQHDGRASLLVITDAGRERVEAMRTARRNALDQALGEWTTDEFETLARLLSRFVDAADSLLPSPCDRGRGPAADSAREI